MYSSGHISKCLICLTHPLWWQLVFLGGSKVLQNEDLSPDRVLSILTAEPQIQ